MEVEPTEAPTENAQPGKKRKLNKYFRVHAHRNPLSDGEYEQYVVCTHTYAVVLCLQVKWIGANSTPSILEKEKNKRSKLLLQTLVVVMEV
jgi:hypothetical protein